MKKRKITDAIVIHCTATPEGRDYRVEEIREWHRARGFEDIGYHYLIGLNGEVKSGRSEELEGAHCPEGGMNRRGVSVCYVGGVDNGGRPKDTRTKEQKLAMESLVRRLMAKFQIRKERVYGHNEFARKACPSFDVRTWVRSFACLFLLVMVMTACSPKVIRTESVRDRIALSTIRDTVYLKSQKIESYDTRDTVLIRERGDTIYKEAVRWRVIRKQGVDTVSRVVRDTIYVRDVRAERIEGEATSGREDSGWWIVGALMIGAVALWRMRSGR